MSRAEEPIRVLHVDDDTEFAEMAATFLEREDGRMVVRTTSSPAAGLDLVAEEPVDCVVSDYDMPGTTGIEFLEAVREEYPDLPFILYTGKGSEEVAADAISAGVTDYLQKESGTDQYTILANRIRNAVSARRSATDAERSRYRLEQVLKTVPGCVVQLDAEGRFVFANDRAVEVLGLEESELTDRAYNDPGWEIRDLDGSPIPDEELPFRRVLDSGAPLYGVRHTIRWPDGTRRVLSVNGAPLFDGDGEVESVVFSLTDITDRQEREDRLRQTTARLQALFENSPDMINVHDSEGNIIDPNPRLCEETGYSEAELTGMKVWDLDRAIDPDGARALWEGMETGDRERLEGRFRRRDGSEVPVEVHVRRLDLDGEPRFVVISRKIAEHKERERELEHTNRILSTLFETLPVGVTVLDADGTIVRANRRAEDTLGLSESDITDRTYADPEWNIFGEDGEPVPAEELPFARAVETGEAVFGYEHGIEWPDGGKRWLSINAAPITTVEGVEKVVATVTDVTDSREYERAIETQNQRLEEFASIVSHDLRNPLNVAQARLDLARREPDGEHLDAVEHAHDRMEALITDLLTLAQEGEAATDLEDVELGTLARNCWRNVDTADATLRAATDLTVRADESRLSRLFENLMRNAVEHGGPEVTVTVGGLDGGFYVADDGRGIPTDAREEVFEAGHTTSADGTGFGLSIVAGIVEAHGWQIRVVDGPEGGTRFEVTGVETVDG